MKRNHKPKVDWLEEGELVFTINFSCPHCKKPLAISLDKVTMKPSQKSKTTKQ